MMRSLQARLLVTVALVALAVVAAVTLGARRGARREFERFRAGERTEASGRLPAVGAGIARLLDGRCCEPALMATAAASLPPGAILLVVNGGSGALVASAGSKAAALEQIATRREGDVLTLEAVRGDGRRFERIALQWFVHDPPAVRLAGGGSALAFVVPVPANPADANAVAFLGSLDRYMLLAAGGVATLTVLVTWLLARSVIRPLEALRAATRRLASGDLASRVVPGGGRELMELGRAFNAMAGDLERQQALRRDLVHDVAHELRTPLTAVRCRLETVLDGLAADPAQAVRDVHDEVLHLGRLVDDLQDLAHAEARELRIEDGDVRVADVVASALKASSLDGDPRVHVDVPAGIVGRGDAARVRQVVLNLLTNADRYTPAGGAIRLEGRVEGHEAILEVRNTGSSLDDEQLRRLFDRFYRTDPSRQRVTGGTGLGLAIVKHLVEAQGGRVWATSADDSVTVGFALRRGPA